MKNILINLASKIISKYGIFELQPDTKIRLYGMVFRVASYQLKQSVHNGNELEIHFEDVAKYINVRL